MKGYLILVMLFSLTGCVTKLSGSDFDKYKSVGVREFLSDFWYINKIDNDLYVYDAAFLVEKQVRLPIEDLINLCKSKEGTTETLPYSGKISVSDVKVRLAAINSYITHSMENGYELNRQITAYKFNNKFMKEYVDKMYFTDELTCRIRSGIIWKVRVLPDSPRDVGGVDSLRIYMKVL